MARNRPQSPRVFCVGWHKTGTSTLGLALIELGYSVLGCRLDMVHPLRAGDIDAVLDLGGQFDALQDVPWAALFRELDERYPGSRFILTERDDEAWLKSARRHFKDTEIPLHEWLYGQGRLIGSETIYLDRYRQHNHDVRQYFRSRPDDLLVMNLEAGHGWLELCRFLGHGVPERSFPHANKAPHSYNARDKAREGLRRRIPEPVRRAIFNFRQSIRDFIGRPDPRNRFNNFRENRAERLNWKKDIR
ncbi:MAG: sulfotransferase family protein [Wenzhouxiangella sp.]